MLLCCTALVSALVAVPASSYAGDESSSAVADREAASWWSDLPQVSLDAAVQLPTTIVAVPAWPMALMRIDAAAAATGVGVNTANATSFERKTGRPGALIQLYVSFAALQVMDIHSTRLALAKGHTEMNPLVAPVATSGAFAAYKIATTAGLIAATEQLRKKHPKAAVVVMVVLTSAYSTIVAQNYRLAAR
jgi:hypothetical protein